MSITLQDLVSDEKELKFYFKCISPGVSPNAPLFVTEQFWEAEEMKRNPEYVRVDKDGREIVSEEANAESRIPFSPPAPTKRPVLRAPKRK